MVYTAYFRAARIGILFGVIPGSLFALNRYVGPGDSLQRVLNDAVPGDTITLQSGATYTGNFVLPKKSGNSWIVIQSSLATSMPTAFTGGRVQPFHSLFMAKIVSPNTKPALATAPGAHHYRIRGLEATVAPGIYVDTLVRLGAGTEKSELELPHAIVLDRVYVHGDPAAGGKRGIGLNSKSTTITNSYISDFKSSGQDSQAICGWNGPGPFTIVNNYVEAAGENIMFGGATPAIPDMVPSDILIRNNHLKKPLAWRVGDPSFAGRVWLIKNLLELKNARRVTIKGNIIENNWAHGQNGFAILFTVRTERGRAPWAVVEDVRFEYNIVRHASGGINILGKDDGGGNAGAARRITVRHNVLEDIDHMRWGGTGRAIQLLNGWSDITIENNTIVQTGPVLVFGNAPGSGLIYRSNTCSRGTYGILGSGKAEGTHSLEHYAPGSVVTMNIISGAAEKLYPSGNYFPAALHQVFVDLFFGNYRLREDCPFRNGGLYGRAPGASIPDLLAATVGAVSVVQ